MARSQSREVMGFLVMEEEHHPAIFSLLEARPDNTARILDPFAGEGVFLEAAAKAWNLTPYANELDSKRANLCRQRFGAANTATGDALRLIASNHAFSVLWINPPYDKLVGEADRTELLMLRHSLKWARTDAVVFWAVYKHHLSDKACQFLSKQLSQIQIWGLPGKHLGEFDQVLVTGILRRNPLHAERYTELLLERENPIPLTVQDKAVYQIPQVSDHSKFSFTSEHIDSEQAFALSQQSGASLSPTLYEYLHRKVTHKEQIKPVVHPRPGHTALVLAAGITDGTVLKTENSRSAVRGKIKSVDEISRVIVEEDPNNSERSITHTHIRRRPFASINLLSEDGSITRLDGDIGILEFVQKHQKSLAAYLNKNFKPLYNFDYRTKHENLQPYLQSLRVMGKYPLFTAQKHVIAAISRGLEEKRGIFVCGQMGVGKTPISSSVVALVSGNIVRQFAAKTADDKISLIICPPHLLDKWRRELHSIYPDLYFQACRRHEEVHAFMQGIDSNEAFIKLLSAVQIQSLFISKNKQLGHNKLFTLHLWLSAVRKTPKVMLIKRDMTKLGCIHKPAVSYKKHYSVRWKQDDEPPTGYEDSERIIVKEIPCCPTCGAGAFIPAKGSEDDAILTEAALREKKHYCYLCHSPLWTEARSKEESPKPGQKFPPHPARYRLDKYFAKAYRHRIHLLVWDEIHEAQRPDRGNGEAFSRLASISDKVLVGTGTPFNGKCSSTFNFEYHLNTRVRKRYPWGGSPRLSKKSRGYKILVDDAAITFNQKMTAPEVTRGQSESQWVRDMGIRERVIDEYPEYDSKTGVYTGTATYHRPYIESNGINPRLVAEMLDHSIYLSLEDLGIALPPIEEIPVPVEMDDDIGAAYRQTEATLLAYLKAQYHKRDVTFRGAYVEWARGWPNRPEKACSVIHNRPTDNKRIKDKHVVASIEAFDENRIFKKEQALLDILKLEISEDRPCILYVRQTITNDIRPRLEKLIKEHVPNAQVYSLPSSIVAERREAKINEQLEKGMNILITAPQPVATGLDLIAFKNIIWYETTYDLRIFTQASSRTRRANSDPSSALRNYFIFWEGTMEHRAIQIISRKQRSAKLLTGDIGLSGLDSLTADEVNFEEDLVNTLLNGSEELVDPRKAFSKEVEIDPITKADLDYWAVNEGLETETKYQIVTPWQILKAIYEKDRPMLELTNASTMTTNQLPLGVGLSPDIGTKPSSKKSTGKTDSGADTTLIGNKGILSSERVTPSLFSVKVQLGRSSIPKMPQINRSIPQSPSGFTNRSENKAQDKAGKLQSRKPDLSQLPKDRIFPERKAPTQTASQSQHIGSIQTLVKALRDSQQKLKSDPIFPPKATQKSESNGAFNHLLQQLHASSSRVPRTEIRRLWSKEADNHQLRELEASNYQEPIAI